MFARVRTVNAIVEQSRRSGPIRKADLRSGDRLRVATENSIYFIDVLEDATYRIRGGWFDRQRLSPVTLSISGCTWGGTVIRTDIIGARGLHLEFGNGVVTSRIREVRLLGPGDRRGQTNLRIVN